MSEKQALLYSERGSKLCGYYQEVIGAMNNEPLDRLILLRLALEGGEIKNSDFKPALNKPDRDRLIHGGLLEKEDRRPPQGGRKAMHLVLSERGWGWLAENLAGDLPPRASAVKPLRQLLVPLQALLVGRGISMAEFLTGPNRRPARIAEEVDQQIERAYYRLSGGQKAVPITLADLRAELPDVPRGQLDQALLGMASRGGVALYALENPLEIRPEDKQAVLHTPNGQERHLIYLGGMPS